MNRIDPEFVNDLIAFLDLQSEHLQNILGFLDAFRKALIRRDLPVLYTRYRPKKIVRVRKCRHCRRRVITYEAIGAWRIPAADDSPDQQRGLGSAFTWSDSGD